MIYEPVRQKSTDFFDKTYDQIVYYSSKDGEKYLGDKDNRKCRFCGKNEGEITFKKIAHAIPESTGNKFLFTYYECDSCNSFFGSNIESEFANRFLHLHALLGIRGKRNEPTFQNDEGKQKIFTVKDKERRTRVIQDTKDKPMVSMEESNIFNLTMMVNTFIPVAVFKCFVKMAISIMPEKEIDTFSETIKWLLEEEYMDFYDGERQLFCKYKRLRVPTDAVECTLFRRKRTVWDYPYMLFQLTYGAFSYLIEVPRDRERDKQLKTIEKIQVPLVVENDVGNDKSYDLTSNQKVKNLREEMPVFYEEREDCNKQEREEMAKKYLK